MQKMTVNEAEWYGAECAIQDAMNGASPIAGQWATSADFANEAAYTQFLNVYYWTYLQTRGEVLRAQKFDT